METYYDSLLKSLASSSSHVVEVAQEVDALEKEREGLLRELQAAG